MRHFALFAAGLCLALSAPAAACSVVSGYRVPSNFELVKKADLIVLARVASGPAMEALTAEVWDKPLVTIETVRVLKGELPEEPLALMGYVSVEGQAAMPHPTPLHVAHPSTMAGACSRQIYPVGALLVAIFQRTEQGWRQERSPFARSVEDVEGENGTWVRAVASYAEIAALPDGTARRAALEAEAKRLLMLTDDPAAPPIAADMLEAAANELD